MGVTIAHYKSVFYKDNALSVLRSIPIVSYENNSSVFFCV